MQKARVDMNKSNKRINKVVLVGHCSFDQSSLKKSITEVCKNKDEVKVVSVNDADSLDEHADDSALLLINRVLDGRFQTASGIELISTLAKQAQPPRIMLVSNYPEAQQQAVDAGACPGFGKNDIGRSKLTDVLNAALNNYNE